MGEVISEQISLDLTNAERDFLPLPLFCDVCNRHASGLLKKKFLGALKSFVKMCYKSQEQLAFFVNKSKAYLTLVHHRLMLLVVCVFILAIFF